MKYVAITFTVTGAGQADIVIALLAETGFEGFEEDGNMVKAFIKEEAFDKAALEEVTGGLGITYNMATIDPQNWNAQWESSFDPVIVNDFAAVRAGFHPPVKNVRHEIIITPKMSFGTGHHATTYLMMEQMSQLDFTNTSVMDFGTGTGVLAILAEKMGALSIAAIDNDDWSIENALENTGYNHCKKIVVKKAEAIEPNEKYDIILANINLNVILDNMPAIAAACTPGASVLLSGFLVADEGMVTSALAANELAFREVNEKNGWICIQAAAS